MCFRILNLTTHAPPLFFQGAPFPGHAGPPMAPAPNPVPIQVAPRLYRAQLARPAPSAPPPFALNQQQAAQQQVQQQPYLQQVQQQPYLQQVQQAAQQHVVQEWEGGNQRQGGPHMSPTYGSGATSPSEIGFQGQDPSSLQDMYNYFAAGCAVRGLFMHSHSGHACPATHLDMAPTLLLLQGAPLSGLAGPSMLNMAFGQQQQPPAEFERQQQL